MPPSPKRRKLDEELLNGEQPDATTAFTSKPLEPATPREKRLWQGFCEIESEPALFNVMLKDFGVQGVKVQEVFGLDEQLLDMLPKPVYGLIFLYRYKTDDGSDQVAICPENVWFANQTADFSCATVSLLNIVNNIPDAHLGENLQAFKDFTKDFPPALRGDAIVNFTFVKEIHNSFARKMDMLNIDLGLQNSYDDRRKTKSTPNTPKKDEGGKPAKKKAKVITDDDYDDAAFHFSAYVPIDGQVWKLDGLDRQPRRIGPFSDNEWLSVVTPVLQERMSIYAEGDIEFSLLSLVKDPLWSHQNELASNIKAAQTVEAALDNIQTDWKMSLNGDASKLSSSKSDALLGITEQMISEAPLSHESEINDAEADTSRLIAVREEISNENAELRRLVADELHSARQDEQQAFERRQDYAPVINKWLRMLAEKDGLIKELIEENKAKNGITDVA